MKLLFFLLAGSLLRTGSTFAQAPATQWPRSLSSAGSESGSRPARVPVAVQVFSSPTHGDFTVKLPDASPRAGLQLELVNVLGRVVFQQPLPTAAQFTVLAGAVPTGLYWVRLRGPQGYQATQRLVLS